MTDCEPLILNIHRICAVSLQAEIFGLYYTLAMPAAPSIPAWATEAKRPRARVLFVDDEPHVVGMTERLLRSCGFEVASFTSSREALERFSAAPDAFDLVITDQQMPELRGDMLARELRELSPELPIIMCSGSSDESTRDAVRELGVQEFLTKPLTIAGLTDAVERALR